MDKTKKINPKAHEPKKEVSWRAIFAGTLTVLSILLILNLIGLAFGMGAIEPTEENNPLSGIGTGALIWWVLSNLIALFAGGFVAARVGVSLTNISGVIQGIMTWALYAFLSIWILTSTVGSVISGVGSAVGGVISTAGETASEEFAPEIEKQVEELDMSLEDAKERIYSLMREADSNPDEIQESASQELRDGDIEQAFRDAKNRLTQTFDEIDRDELVNVLVERTDMSEGEAEDAVDNALADYESLRQDVDEFLADAEEEARDQGEKVAEAGTKAAGYLSMALILGLFAAAIGGIFGVRDLRDDFETHYVHPDPASGSHVHPEPHPSDDPHPSDAPGR